MRTCYWIMGSVANGIALLTALLGWCVARFIVPPMVEAVPGIKWTGLAAFWVWFSDYPIMVVLVPLLIGGCTACLWFYSTAHGKYKASPLPAVLVMLLALLFLIILLNLAILGTFEMQDQMVAGMGLGG